MAFHKRYLVIRFIFPAALFLLGGCALNNLDTGYVLQDPAGQGVVLIGMGRHFKTMAFQGEVVVAPSSQSDTLGSQFKLGPGSAEFSIAPVENRVIATMKAAQGDSGYAIARLADPDHLLPVIYYSCGKTVPVFHIKSGAINYIGDYSFDESGGWLDASVNYDEAAAQAFIKAHYPGLSGLPFVTEHVTFMPTIDKNCAPTIIVPIPVG